MIDFPPFPVVDEEYTASNGFTYIWSGKTWTRTFNTKLNPTKVIDNIENVNTGPMNPKGNQMMVHKDGEWVDSSQETIMEKRKGFIAYSASDWTPPTRELGFYAMYDTVWWDSEGGYDTVNYEYTIPISGYWQIHSRITARDLREYYWHALYKNGVNHTYICGTSDSTGGQESNVLCAGSTFQHFNQGDVIKIYCYWYGYLTYMYWYGGQKWNQFTGYLIQAD